MLELFLALSASLEAIYLLFMLSISITKCSPTSTIFLHRVFYDFWISCRIEIFEFRSTHIYLILHDTHLTSGFTGVLCFHRWSPCLHPPPTHQSIACTYQGVCLPFWRMVATHSDFRWILVVPCDTHWREAFQESWMAFKCRLWQLPIPLLHRICVVVKYIFKSIVIAYLPS